MSIKKTSLAWIYCFSAVCWLVLRNNVHMLIKNWKLKRLINLLEENPSLSDISDKSYRKRNVKCHWLLSLKNCLILSSSIKRGTAVIIAATCLYEKTQKSFSIELAPPLFDVIYFISASLEWAPFFSQKGAHLKNST